MAESINNVSQPPLTTSMINPNGTPSRAWGNWFRDLYRRTSYKGGNAIDDNKTESDQEFLVLESTLEETIQQVNLNIESIDENETSINQVSEDLETHKENEEAHGANGAIVGFEDKAENLKYGLVKSMAEIANAIESTVEVTVADVADATALYDQAHSQALTDLANANKQAINSLVTDFNNAVIVLNELISKSKTSGQMES